jgi:tRNA(His) guanylyltransferase
MTKALGDRMKHYYEDRSRLYLARRIPVIMRLDGKTFHTLTRNCDKPYDGTLARIMVDTAKKLVSELQGAKCAYIQSDEITILITDYEKLTTEAWFDYNVQKMCSVAASIATVTFNKFMYLKDAYFDCRVFNIPKEDVTNNFVWRQKDWFRNSIHLFALAYFSHKELQGKKSKDMHEMLHGIGRNWTTDLLPWQKNGTFITKESHGPGWENTMFPVFTDSRELIEAFL